jgi:hypothetical protein
MIVQFGSKAAAIQTVRPLVDWLPNNYANPDLRQIPPCRHPSSRDLPPADSVHGTTDTTTDFARSPTARTAAAGSL